MFRRCVLQDNLVLASRGTCVYVFFHAESEYPCLEERKAIVQCRNMRNMVRFFELTMTPCDPLVHFMFFRISAESYLTNVTFPGLGSDFCFRDQGVWIQKVWSILPGLFPESLPWNLAGPMSTYFFTLITNIAAPSIDSEKNMVEHGGKVDNIDNVLNHQFQSRWRPSKVTFPDST